MGDLKRAKDRIIRYKETESVLVPSPLAWQLKGLQQTATGYGSKLTTIYKTAHNGRMYRVYAVCWSNASTLYILPGGRPLYLADSTIRRRTR